MGPLVGMSLRLGSVSKKPFQFSNLGRDCFPARLLYDGRERSGILGETRRNMPAKKTDQKRGGLQAAPKRQGGTCQPKTGSARRRAR